MWRALFSTSFIQVNTILTVCAKFIRMKVSLFYPLFNLSTKRVAIRNSTIQMSVAIKPMNTTGSVISRPRAKIPRRDSDAKVRGRRKLMYFSM